jgi:hypothetical protein
MLPNFTVVICGALLTVLMLAVAGSGLIDPETRTRIGAMPEISRPMVQRMITEPAVRAQFAALEMSRRAEELMRLRDLAPAIAEPALPAEHDDPARSGLESGAPPPQSTPPPDTVAGPAIGDELAPAAGTEAVPTAEAAAAAEAVLAVEAVPAEAVPVTTAAPAADAAPAAVPQAAEPTAVAEEAPARDSARAPAPEISELVTEPGGEPAPVSPIGTPVAPPTAAPERIAAAPLAEPPATTEHDEPAAEMPSSPSLELALAEPTAVPTEETPAKRETRAAEPQEAMPVRRPMPRFVPLLPRVIPSLARRAPARLGPSPARITPMLSRHARANAKAEAAKPDVAKAAAAPRKPVRHVIRQVQHRAQRTYVAPGTAVSPYSAYSVTSGVQYK